MLVSFKSWKVTIECNNLDVIGDLDEYFWCKNQGENLIAKDYGRRGEMEFCVTEYGQTSQDILLQKGNNNQSYSC